jgi:tartronate-semialdehyde synthase
MSRMTAVGAALCVLKEESFKNAFGSRRSTVDPLYAAVERHGRSACTLARHEDGASHVAEGYTGAETGDIGVCIATSGLAGTDMISGLYSAQDDSIPILCITGRAPLPRLCEEYLQMADIETIAELVVTQSVTVP